MIAPWLGIGLVMLSLGLLQGTVSMLGSRYTLHPEVMRKIVHVTMGLVCLSFPWVFDEVWPALLLTIIASSWLIATRTIPPLRAALGRALNCTSRSTAGDISFCVGVGLLFWLSYGNQLFYVLPVAILTFADAAAALIGVFYGKHIYQTRDGIKSLQGSCAFMLVCFGCTYFLLVSFGGINNGQSFLISCILACLITMLEGVSWGGLDNVSIPLGSFVLLSAYTGAPVVILVEQLLIAVMLILCALLIMKREQAWNS